MAIASYEELKSALANWLHRDDLDTILPTFIALAESKIGSSFRAREQETATDLLTVAGVSSVALPSDYHSLKNIQIAGAYNTVLTMLPDDALIRFNASNTNGLPEFYCIQGGNILLARTPDIIYTLNAVYYAKIPSLSGAEPTNWLLTKAPQLYLYGALVEAMMYTQDDERLQTYDALFQKALQGVISSANIESFSGSPLRSVSDYVC